MARSPYVALLTGPMQAVSAVEAVHSLKTKAVAFYYSASRPLPTIYHLYGLAGIELHWLDRGRYPGRVLGFSRILAQVLQSGRLMLGSLHQRPFLVAAVLARDELVLLDDGALTETIARRRRNGRPARSRLGRRVDSRPMTFFSIYSPPLKPGDTLVLSRLEYVRSLFTGATRLLDEAWIVGQAFVGHGLMSFHQYLSLLRRFTTTFADGALKLVYVQHPRESDQDATAVCSELGLHRRRLDGPIELEILRRREMPRKVFSVGSTVLDSLPLLAPDFPPGLELWTAAADPDLLRDVPEALVHRLRALRSRRDLRFAGEVGTP